MRHDMGILLYGPPAAGKDTITAELCRREARYVPFRRLKVGGGRTDGYRLTTPEDLVKLRARGELIYTNSRYGATYAVDRAEIAAINGRNQIPILHLGQVAGIDAVQAGYSVAWLIVGLWCERDEAARRLAGRGDQRTDERLAAWDATLVDLRSADPALFDLMLNTGRFSPQHAAEVIAECCR
jgi:guanylate kinase